MPKPRRRGSEPPSPHNKPFRVRWQDWRGWTERQMGGKRHRQPPAQHRDFATEQEAEAFAEQLRADRGSDCLIAVLRVPTLERPIQPKLDEPPWPPQARRLT
jgi:hypothetical protein